MTSSDLIIENLLVLPALGELQQVVRAVSWRLDGVATGGVTRLPDPDAGSFVPFDRLDLAGVQAWIPDDAIQSVLRANVEQWQAPPWSAA